MDSVILDLREKLKKGELKPETLINHTLENSKVVQDNLNPFVTICDQVNLYEEESVLSGIPYVAKDNLSTKDILSTGSSNTLKDYVPFFDATVIDRLNKKGAVLVGKSAMDELGLGGTGTTCHTGVTKNPWDKTRITGGSSSGSACLVASGVVPFALGSDTGDSIRKPAAFCGIVGYKPTYGAISRFGLFPFASSLDTVGVLTRTVKDAAIVVDNVLGIDENDMTSINLDANLSSSLKNDIKGKKLFYIKNMVDINNYDNPSEDLKNILSKFNKTIELVRSLGAEVEEISFDQNLLNAILPIYQCISCAEATSNDSNLTGIIFGPRGEGDNYIDMIKDHRTKGFCSLIKRRFIIGSYVLQKENQEKYFLNAKRVRRLLVEKINELFEMYDALIMPATGSIAPKIDSINEVINDAGSMQEVLENYMAIGNFGGYPSITIPNGFINSMPIGINITGKVMDDANVLNIAYTLESNMSYRGQIAKEVK
ncbi:MAG: aspartyl/glutamyl-tRNA amidotransferase subunit A [Bacilli bacterium]|nr:aspartyl/glutamyl-tRNA amidotransferase subunit A [Bacilli bacterium]